jgi:hypothetical protein
LESRAAPTVASGLLSRTLDIAAIPGPAGDGMPSGGIVTPVRPVVLQASELTIRTLAWRFEEVLRLGDGTEAERSSTTRWPVVWHRRPFSRS